MADEPRRYGRDEVEFARALTFFDAIYAFALTLLVTTIDDFSPDAWRSLPAFLQANGPSLLSFLISFIVVVQFWRASHRELSTLRHLDNRLITVHSLVMFGVVLLPFTTEALGKPGLQDLPLPVAAYAVNVTAIYLLQQGVSIVADRSDLRIRPKPAVERRHAAVMAVLFPLVFLGSIPVAYLVSPGAAERCWLLLVVLPPLLSRWSDRRAAAGLGTGERQEP